MGVKLVNQSEYNFNTKTFSKKFFQGVEYHDLSPDVEKYLLHTGYFVYVPTEGNPVPKEVMLADRNRQLILEGKIKPDGTPIKQQTAVEGLAEEEAVAPKKKTINLSLDEDGNEITEEVLGASCLEEEAPINPTPKKRRSVEKDFKELEDFASTPVSSNDADEEFKPAKKIRKF